MPVQTKICGLATPETLDAAVSGGASHVGFVFLARSPRNIEPDRAAALVSRVPPHVTSVGVFVEPDDALLERAVHAGLEVVQLHGSETPQRAYEIKTRFQVGVWKAIPVRTRYDLGRALTFVEAADRVLFDAKVPAGTDLPGGMGLRFDWRLLERHRHRMPWALSGGLDAGNVADAIAVTGAPLVDVSSGVERAPGVKDVDKIAAFLQSVARS